MTDGQGSTRLMQQVAPWPDQLAALVDVMRFMPDWRFDLVDDDQRDEDTEGRPVTAGLTLWIHVTQPDAYHPDRRRTVLHKKIVPAATFNRGAWERWLLEQCLDVLRHEACEFLAFGDHRPFSPTHGKGDDPYVIHEYATGIQRRTRFDNRINPQ